MIAGSTRWAGEPVPEAGSHCRFTAKIRMSRMPTQNAGVDWPTRTEAMTEVSVALPLLTAATIPAGIETIRVNAIAATARSIVSGRRSMMTSNAGRWKNTDWPKSRPSRPVMYETYWSSSGRSKPRLARSARSCSTVASGGSICCTGSPASLTMKNATVATQNSTSRVWPTLLPMKPIMRWRVWRSPWRGCRWRSSSTGPGR